MTQPDPLPTSLPTGEDDAQPLEQRLEERFALKGKSLRRHTAQGALINSAFQVGLAGVGLLKRVGVAAFLTLGEYGLWGILVTTLITLSWLKQVGISDKYIQQDDPDQELAFQKAFTLEVAYTMCYYPLVLVSLPIYALAYDQPDIILPGFILSLSFLATALHTPIWISYRQMRFVRQRTLESVDPLLSAAVTIGLAAAGFGYWSLVVGAVTGSFAAAAVALATSQYRIAWRFDSGALREYFGFSWPLFVSGLSGIVVVQGSVLVGNHTVGLAGVGAIALATSFTAFAGRVDDIISRTIYPAVCAVSDRRALLFEAFEKSNRLAVMWGLAFGFGLVLFAGDLVTYLLGERWRPAEGLLQAFGLIVGFRQVGFNWTIFMRAVGWTKPIAVWGVLSVVNFAVVTAPLMFWLGLDGFALGMGAGLLLNLGLRGYYLSKLFDGFNIGRHLVRSVAPMVVPVVAILGLRALEAEPRTAGMALIEVIAYSGLTVAMLWLFERPLLREVLGYMRRAPRATPAA